MPSRNILLGIIQAEDCVPNANDKIANLVCPTLHPSRKLRPQGLIRMAIVITGVPTVSDPASGGAWQRIKLCLQD
jgi:hypothetical protein